MLKKIITTAVLGVSALGVMAANAATPGVYVSGQLGYANAHMGNKLNIANDINNIVSPFSDDQDTLSVQSLGANKVSDNGLAGRLALGYQFSQNFAVELGYMQLHGGKTNANYAITDTNIDPEYNNTVNVNGKLKLNQNAIDVAAKGILPIASNFNVYGKLGVAYLTTTVEANSISVTDAKNKPANFPIPSSMTLVPGDVAKHIWAPEAAVGVSYDITPNVSVDTSWTHIQPVGKNRPGNIDFVAVGLGYHFG
ncbi:outer membrane beta-barrel protein [Rickettsiella endosymbiont of Dermanyssus gallinae]|uniref:outer membrane beta-barrel protein n=1 Tax=Rickettsiella endosymbiont of Dermanyssus gallinae TaxID=2856608 RepID=UPI001C52D9E9|nr:outer membrane beta-barrel protein [Rickettsiella endosymbiont of Dermanyssus gallinae]